MPRSVWKGPYVNYKLFKKVYKSTQTGSNAPIKTWARSCEIIQAFVDKVFLVHNGRAHIPICVTADMIGHKLGEFVPTRLFKGHSGDKAVKGKKGAKK